MKKSLQKFTKSENPTTKKGVKNPSKKAVFTRYAFWVSMPFVFRKISEVELSSILGIEIDDEEFMRLFNYRTKTQFSEGENISRVQLNKWNEMDLHKKLVDKFNNTSNIMKFKKDIDYHFTQKTIKESDAKRVKLWYQIFMGWSEKNKLELGEKTLDAIIDIQNRMVKIAEG